MPPDHLTDSQCRGTRGYISERALLLRNRTGCQVTSILQLSLPESSTVTVSKLVNFSMPHFPHLNAAAAPAEPGKARVLGSSSRKLGEAREIMCVYEEQLMFW